MTPEATILVVDDDDALRDSLCVLFESAGLHAIGYSGAGALLAANTTGTAQCLVADIRMPGMTGLALQQELVRRGQGIPVILITGHGDIAMAVNAMKAGAFDFLEKPCDDAILIASVRRALAEGHRASQRAAEADAAIERIALLTDRERQVLELLIAAKSNKVVAQELGISHRTVEIHRAKVIEKLAARGLSDLVRIALAAGMKIVPAK